MIVQARNMFKTFIKTDFLIDFSDILTDVNMCYLLEDKVMDKINTLRIKNPWKDFIHNVFYESKFIQL